MKIIHTEHKGEPTSVQNAPVSSPKPDRLYGRLRLYPLDGYNLVSDESGDVGVVTACDYQLQRDGTREGTFARIVNTWNACENVSTEELQALDVGSLIKANAELSSQVAALKLKGMCKL